MFHPDVRPLHVVMTAFLALAPSLASAGELSEVRLHCRGARTLVDDEGRTSYRWVKRAFDVDYGAQKVFDEAGEPLASEITPDEIRLKLEIAGWPPGRVRLVTIDRASGAWSARPLDAGDVLDRTQGTCLRLAS